ncbi:Acyl-CoA dehydrogenase/oxidase C-terminal [Syntrophomonas zehnderi OL-4]|uniref:Acyl-CoA dehydrogenase/oxidase C-terminal n=1 Tax=Syntrophomonas zehnderi OL-4 TaxID=690567 RepID=A0A0E4C9I3_9FIRM|nr:acyl-CoA dehydrogenase family protein [Syntrophomonas zehnderi]CFX99191.1 Acyl-CoA dehydrogenase/oxidase C-terminal [Syntrophomonas zehnderi OL-4]
MFRSTISEQDRDLVMMVRELVQTQIAPQAIMYDAQNEDSFDWSAVDILADHNLLALSIPEEYGGRGLSHLTTTMIIEEIAAGCAGVATVVAANLHAASPLLISGTEEQRRQFLPLLTAQKARLGGLAMMENQPNLDILARSESLEILGSSIYALEDDNDDILILNGFKDYVMNGQVASFITFMFTLPPQGGKNGIQVAVLPADTPGIRLGRVRHKLGLKYCSTCELIFEDVKLNPEYLIGKPRSGFLIFMQNLDRCLPYVGAIALGVARSAYDTALAVSKKKFVLGRPSFEESAISFALVDMAAKLNAARLSVHLASWLIDQELDSSQASSKSKIISSRVAQEITTAAMEITGGRAYIRGYPSEKYLRDAKMLSMIDGSEQFHKALIASQF